MRVVHLQPLPDWIRELFGQALAEADIRVTWAGEAADADLRELAAGADVLLTARRRIEADLLATPGLRLVQVQGRAPWAVDWAAAEEARVPVSVLPHRGAIAVAEQTMALMLGLYRMLVEGHEGTVRAAYRQLGLEPVRTHERKIAFNWLRFEGIRQLHGRTLGLVGLGDIGLEVARRARAFDMEVVYYKPGRLPAEHAATAGVRPVSLDQLLTESDVVSLHAPHTDQTEAMIDAAVLAAMKADAILVNTARGGLVDEQALARALQEGVIAGAALDAFAYEPLPEGHALVGCPNVLFSPHVGGGTGGGQRGMIQDVVGNLSRLAEGSPPMGLVGSGPEGG